MNHPPPRILPPPAARRARETSNVVGGVAIAVGILAVGGAIFAVSMVAMTHRRAESASTPERNPDPTPIHAPPRGRVTIGCKTDPVDVSTGCVCGSTTVNPCAQLRPRKIVDHVHRVCTFECE